MAKPLCCVVRTLWPPRNSTPQLCRYSTWQDIVEYFMHCHCWATGTLWYCRIGQTYFIPIQTLKWPMQHVCCSVHQQHFVAFESLAVNANSENKNGFFFSFFGMGFVLHFGDIHLFIEMSELCSKGILGYFAFVVIVKWESACGQLATHDTYSSTDNIYNCCRLLDIGHVTQSCPAQKYTITHCLLTCNVVSLKSAFKKLVPVFT